MGVHVDKKIIQFFFGFVIDIYDPFLHVVHEKNEKIQSKPQGANILGVIN
jgi:hypothetical protein